MAQQSRRKLKLCMPLSVSKKQGLTFLKVGLIPLAVFMNLAVIRDLHNLYIVQVWIEQ
jgi:hypothetical protein